MNNPFKFSGIVQDPAFCNREKEQKELRQYLESSQNVLLYSHRRYGKSSLILKMFKDLKKVTPVYVDISTGLPEPRSLLHLSSKASVP